MVKHPHRSPRREYNPTPADETAALIRAYAQRAIDDNGGTAPIALFDAIMRSEGSGETCYLGAALILRHNTLADASHRIGCADCDPALTVIAARLLAACL